MYSGNESTNILVVCGPTASGKTHLAVELAKRFDGEIISADSRQVYRGMDIGTGKDLNEYVLPDGSRVPNYCIDIADPHKIYTLFHYLQDCRVAFDTIVHKKKIPIMAGGTGLYIEAFLKGYRIPNVPEDPQLRHSLMSRDKKLLQNRLEELDSELYAKTDLSSKKRIVRAIEIALFAQKQEIIWGNENPPYLKPLIIGINPPRQLLYDRIDRRLEERLSEGMVDEVKRLVDSGVSRCRLELFGMEYKRIASFLHGECDYRLMVENLRKDIHHLAKRQLTWFRGMQRRGLAVNWVERAELESVLPLLPSGKR
ncbi:MAG: tRNA (adenosine(37)-N6)-dimethylallyltransferase MiaA [Fibrobacterota bacterium]